MLRSILSLVASACFAGAASAQTALSDADIRSLIVGNTYMFSEGSVVRYDASGDYSYSNPMGNAGRGKWTIGGNQLCVDYTGSNPRRCYRYSRHGQELQVTGWNGNVFRMTPLPESVAVAGAPLALAACEQTFRYAFTPPPAGLPANLLAFSGAWIGKWDSGLCGAVVVQPVLPDGTARLFYVWGSLAYLKPGAKGFTGKIAGDVLSASSENESVEYRMVSPTVLTGKYHLGGVTSGSFTRVP